MSSLAKLTPPMLAQPKVKLTIDQRRYSHHRQASIDEVGVIYMATYNSTQTFDHNGKPRDKDND